MGSARGSAIPPGRGTSLSPLAATESSTQHLSQSRGTLKLARSRASRSLAAVGTRDLSGVRRKQEEERQPNTTRASPSSGLVLERPHISRHRSIYFYVLLYNNIHVYMSLSLSLYTYIYIYICIYIYIYTCVYIYIYIYTCIGVDEYIMHYPPPRVWTGKTIHS